jgi:hypothetical protein
MGPKGDISARRFFPLARSAESWCMHRPQKITLRRNAQLRHSQLTHLLRRPPGLTPTSDIVRPARLVG